MRKILFLTIFLISGHLVMAADAQQKIGIVSFSTCMTESNSGKHEQEQMEAAKKQWGSLIEQAQKEITEVATKFDDQDYLDTLSPEAEEELRLRYRTLNEDLAKYQNQSMRELQQANYFVYYKVVSDVAKASEKIAADKKLTMVINRDSCFYIRPDLDITNEVITEMNKNFENEQNVAKNEENPQEK